MNKKISLSNLEKVLSPKEMKNVKGGSSGKCILKPAGWGYCDGHDGDRACECTNDRWCIGNCG